MNDNPLVSIIIPTFNRGHLIGETLDSIISQSYKNWECIIVDDGSIDNTETVVQEYLKLDSRITFFNRPSDHKKGGNGARNYGLRLSKGDYINWFDSDDLMHESLLQQKIELFKKNEDLEFVICGFTMFQNEKLFENNKWVIENKKKLFEKFLTKEIVLNTPIIMWKRERIKSILFDENLTRAQDLDFIFRALKKMSLKFEITTQPLVNVRIHDQSISQSFKLGKIEDIASEVKVRKSILFYCATIQNKELNNKVRNMYLESVKKALVNKKYGFYFKEIFTVKFLGFNLRLKLINIGLSYAIFKKGLFQYSKLLKD